MSHASSQLSAQSGALKSVIFITLTAFTSRAHKQTNKQTNRQTDRHTFTRTGIKERRRATNLRGVVLLDISQNPDVVGLDEIDGDTLAAETTRPTDPMNVQLTIAAEEVGIAV